MPSLIVTVSVAPDMPRGEVQARTALRNLDGVGRLQRLCERFGVKPTYLLAWPVIGATDLFDSLGERGELGTYLQPWGTPPFEASEDRLSAFAVGTLGSAAAAAKIGHLTDAFSAKFGYAPRCHRAAKAGLTGAVLQALERLEYAVDCTATPFLDQRGRGGCDWRMAPEVPYFPDRQRPTLRGASPVLQVPRTVGWSAAVPDVIARGAARAPDRVRRWLKPGLSIRRLNPHAHDIDALRDLAAVLIDRGLPVLNLSIRSWELTPGTSARGNDAALFEAYFERLDLLLRYLVDQLRLTPRTLTGFARWYLNETAYC